MIAAYNVPRVTTSHAKAVVGDYGKKPEGAEIENRSKPDRRQSLNLEASTSRPDCKHQDYRGLDQRSEYSELIPASRQAMKLLGPPNRAGGPMFMRRTARSAGKRNRRESAWRRSGEQQLGSGQVRTPVGVLGSSRSNPPAANASACHLAETACRCSVDPKGRVRAIYERVDPRRYEYALDLVVALGGSIHLKRAVAHPHGDSGCVEYVEGLAQGSRRRASRTEYWNSRVSRNTPTSARAADVHAVACRRREQALARRLVFRNTKTENRTAAGGTAYKPVLAHDYCR